METKLWNILSHWALLETYCYLPRQEESEITSPVHVPCDPGDETEFLVSTLSPVTWNLLYLQSLYSFVHT